MQAYCFRFYFLTCNCIYFGRHGTMDTGSTLATWRIPFLMSWQTWGTRLEAQHRWWKRVQPLGDWEEDVFQAKMASLQRETTPCEQAFRIRWTGAVKVPRRDPTLQEQTPRFWEQLRMQFIAQAAGKMGLCKKIRNHTLSTGRRECLRRAD